MAVITHPDKIVSRNALLYWRFSENSGADFNDLGSLNADGAATGGVTAGVAGLLAGDSDKGVSISGGQISSGYVITNNGTGFTLSLLARFDSTPVQLSQLIHIGNGFDPVAFAPFFYLRINSGEFQTGFGVSDNPGYANFSMVPVGGIETGKTYFISFSVNYSTGAVLLAINGVTKATTIPNVVPFNGNLFRVGGGNMTNAVFDEASLLPTASTVTQLKQLYRSVKGLDESATAVYAAPDGSDDASGSLANPLSLRELLKGGLVYPGGFAYLIGGTYIGAFRSYLQGESGSRIVCRSVPGQLATINAKGLQGSCVTIDESSQYTDFCFLFVRKQWHIRDNDIIGSTESSIPGSEPGKNAGGSGFSIYGNYTRVYHNWIQDTMNEAVGAASQCIGWQADCNWILNCGSFSPRNSEDIAYGYRRGNGHGIYAQNNSATRVSFSWNTVTGQSACPIKIAGGDSSYSNNIDLIGNCLINGGNGTIVGGGQGITGLVFSKNRVYGGSVALGYDTIGFDLICEDNYLQGGNFGLDVVLFLNARIKGNTFLTYVGAETALRFRARGAYSGWNSGIYKVEDNHYWDVAGNGQVHVGENGAGISGMTFAAYKALTGWDSNPLLPSSFHTSGVLGTPIYPTTNKVFVEKLDKYVDNYGRVIVYNYEDSDYQIINLDPILARGQRYEVRSAVNPQIESPDGIIFEGEWDGVPLNFPLKKATGNPDTIPYFGARHLPQPEVNSEFACFMILPVEDAVSDVKTYNLTHPKTH